jgi:hypothetical protein
MTAKTEEALYGKSTHEISMSATMKEDIFKQVNVKKNFKLEINVIRIYFEFQIYLTTLSVASPIS